MGLSIITVRQGIVTKIATNVLGGVVRNLSLDKELFCTTRATGAEAPSLADISNEGHNLFVKNPVEEEIDSSTAIDVYVISPSGDAKIKVGTP